MPLDMLDRLSLDPGTRTIGELLQEREWAVGEIRRLRMDVGRLSRKEKAGRIEEEMEQRGGLDPKLHAQRLLRLAEVSTMIGLKRSSIYRYVAEGHFPAPIKVGERSVRWRLVDVLAWRAKAAED
jgi:prophage regulatory protein